MTAKTSDRSALERFLGIEKRELPGGFRRRHVDPARLELAHESRSMGRDGDEDHGLAGT